MKSGFLNKTSNNKQGLLNDPRSQKSASWGRPKSQDGNSGGGGWNGFVANASDWEAHLSLPTKNAMNTYDETPTIMAPFLPRSLGKPKNALSVWYGRRHKNFVFCANECFVTWDTGHAHAKFFTSVFTCPVTNEKFGCGTFGNPDSIMTRKEKAKSGESIMCVWYKKKKDAEHAAAARALDCLSYREGDGVKEKSYGLCEEHPYLENDHSFLVPSSAPDEINDQLMRQFVPVNETNRSTENIDITMDDSDRFRVEYDAMRQLSHQN